MSRFILQSVQMGYYYTDLNHCRPVLESHIGERGVRDPYLMRSAEGDKFYLLATDLSIYYRGGWGSAKATTTGSRDLIIWESTDLVNWSEPRAVAVGTEDAGCAWAPEAIYNEETGEYVVYFAQSHVIDGALDKDLRIFVTTTRDFISFSEAQEYIYRADDRSIIDTSMILAEDGYYYRASADGQITLERSRELFGEWEKVTILNDLGFDQDMTGSRLEGPELIRFNKKDWIDGKATYGLFTDQYAEGKGYLPVVTTNLNDADNSDHSWKKLSAGEYSFDMLKKRHGTILNLTQSEYERIKEAYVTNNKESVEKPEDGILADFDFDDREKGFTGGIAIAEANGSVRLDAHNDGKALYLDGSTWIPTGSCTRPRTLLHRFTNQSVILVFWLTMGRPQRNATIMTGNGRRIRRQRREIRGFMWT
ncbi:MAG: glycoside hydrolase family 43 protein [Lachnospiraceae bacterium]|nr:glycoside hydrolase family 43 protein [Lachnospiraceae bacterium]